MGSNDDASEDSLAGRLRSLRSRRGWTREMAAERLGIAAETLARFERGERRPSLTVLLKLARGYGISVDELTGQVAANPDTAVADSVQILTRLDQRRLRLARELLLALERADL